MKKRFVVYILILLSNIAVAQWEYGGIVICPDTWSTYDLNSCSDGQRGIILAWEDYREQYNPDIYVQRVDTAGYELWQENGVQAVINPYGQYYPQIAPDGSGGVFVAWTDLGRIQPNRYSVYAQYIDSSGNLVWPDSGIQIFDDGANHWTWSIIPDNSGGAIIMWDDPAMVQRVDPAGNLLFNNTDGLRMTDSLYDQSYGWLLNSSDSTFVAVWFDGRESGLGPGIYAQKFSSNGQILWDSNGIPVAVAPLNTRRDIFNVTPDLNGGFYAIWENLWGAQEGISMQRVDNMGSPRWGSSGMVISDDFYDANPDIELNFDGRSIISWIQAVPYRCFLNIIDSTGTLQWANHLMIGYNVNTLYGITLSTPGAFEIALRKSDLSCRDRVFKVDLEGNYVWGDTGVCLICPSCPSYRPQIVSDDLGGAYLSWKRFDAGGVMLNRVYPDGWVAPDTTTGLDKDINIPNHFSISTYPNPFNSETRVCLQLSSLDPVEVGLYDLLGRKVQSIYSGIPQAYDLDFTIDLSSDEYSSGIYFIVAKQGHERRIIKSTLLK